jgi:hypothetical protein
MSGLARAALAARGAMYILIGIIAVQIAVDGSHRQADRGGAIRLVAATPFGSLVLWLLVVGFGGMTLWRFSEAAWGASPALTAGQRPSASPASRARSSTAS